MTDNVNRKARNNRIAATLFSLAGLLWVLGGLIGGNIGLYIPIGMMNMCIGMMFLSMSKRAEKTQVGNHQKAEGPNKADADGA